MYHKKKQYSSHESWGVTVEYGKDLECLGFPNAQKDKIYKLIEMKTSLAFLR